jgi:hypothetical protein
MGTPPRQWRAVGFVKLISRTKEETHPKGNVEKPRARQTAISAGCRGTYPSVPCTTRGGFSVRYVIPAQAGIQKPSPYAHIPIGW